MARAQLSGPVRKHTETRILDETGQEIYTTRFVEETRHDPQDGSVNTVRRGESTTLSSGEVYHVGMSAGQNPVMLAAVCDICSGGRRGLFGRRRSHGLTNVQHLVQCCRCGRPVCPRCRRRSPYDQQERCLPCHRWHRLGGFLGTLLFEHTEDR